MAEDEEFYLEPIENTLLASKAVLFIATIVAFVGIPFLPFFGLFSFSPLLSVVVCFFGYFSMPSSYKEKRLYTKIKAWARLFIGGLLALVLGFALNNWTLGLLGAAFFIIIPKKKVPIGQEEGELISDKLIFLVLMIVSLIGIQTWAVSGDLFLITLGIWGVSLIAGLGSHRESRPGVGVFMVLSAIVVYSFAFSGTVGSAMFGAWWPTIQESSEIITEPLGAAWSQISEGMSDSWLMMSCPSCYYEKQMKKMQASSTLTSGGSMLGIEVNKMEFLSSEVDLQQPLAAYAELENKGEFTAGNVKLNLSLPQIKDEKTGSLTAVEGVSRTILTCSGGEIQGGSCVWGKASYPGDVKLISFKYAEDKKWGDKGSCRCVGNDGKSKGSIDCIANETCSKKYSEVCDESKTSCTKEYDYGGKYLSFGFSYSFNYNVNVSLALDIMDRDTLEKKLINKEITLSNQQSRYTGGPVTASIYTERQPVRNGEPTLGVMYITNNGKGKVKAGATYDLYIPLKNSTISVDPISQSGLNCEKPKEGAGNWADYKVIRCTLTKDLEKTKDARYAFTYTYNIASKIADKKSVILVGFVNYDYASEYSKDIMIARTPEQ